ncbi:hypothetical protein MT390_15420 [Vibrio sp. 2-Bac 85]
MKYLYGKSIFLLALTLISFGVKALEDNEDEILSLGNSSIKWIDDIPLKPEDLVGRVYYISDKGFKDFPLSAFLPVEEIDERVVTKSIVKKSTDSGGVSFGGFFELKGEKDKAFEFQVVQGKKWTASPKSKEYETALWDFMGKFKNFDNKTIKEVFMVQAVIKKKVWYKKYTKSRFSANSTYWLNVGNESFSSSSEYEELNQYGLLLVTIKDSNFNLTDALFEKGVELAINDSKVSQKLLDIIPNSVIMFDKGQSIENIKAIDFDKTINQLDFSDLEKIQNKFEELKLDQFKSDKNITRPVNGTR